MQRVVSSWQASELRLNPGATCADELLQALESLGAHHSYLPDAFSGVDYVMTSWHENESMDDAAFFFVSCTDLHGHDCRRFLVLHVGKGPDGGPFEAAVRRQVLDEDAHGTTLEEAPLR